MSQSGSASGAVTSRDGTVVAYDVQGDGPPVVLVAAALSDRGDMKRMSAALSPRFRVINYDRRGRGESGDADAYSTDREIEDIAALIGMAGEPAFLFGSSSGAILALEAASALGNEVRGIAMYEPPLMLNGGRSPVPSSLRSDVRQLLADGRRGAAVRAFMRHALARARRRWHGGLRPHGGGEYRASNLDVLRVEGGRIAEVTTFNPSIFPAFGLPMTMR